jgi:hypothetical protein
MLKLSVTLCLILVLVRFTVYINGINKLVLFHLLQLSLQVQYHKKNGFDEG